MIKKKYIPVIVLAVVLVVMVISNPSPKHFRKYIKQQLINYKFSEKYIDDSLIVTSPVNYVLVSKYSFHINDNGVPMEGDYVGAFGCFFEVGSFTIHESR